MPSKHVRFNELSRLYPSTRRSHVYSSDASSSSSTARSAPSLRTIPLPPELAFDNIQVHNTLLSDYTPLAGHDLRFSILDSGNLRLPQIALNEPACSPPLPSLVIVSKHFPWSISILPQSNAPYVTVSDVFYCLDQVLQRPVSKAEYEAQTPELRRAIAQAFETRYRNAGDAGAAERSKGLKRIDFLCENRRFLGLVGTDTPGVFGLKVASAVGLPSQQVPKKVVQTTLARVNRPRSQSQAQAPPISTVSDPHQSGGSASDSSDSQDSEDGSEETLVLSTHNRHSVLALASDFETTPQDNFNYNTPGPPPYETLGVFASLLNAKFDEKGDSDDPEPPPFEPPAYEDMVEQLDEETTAVEVEGGESFVLAAASAARHAAERQEQIKGILAKHGIKDESAVVLAGFNEQIVRQFAGDIEEIHIFSLVDRCSPSLLLELQNAISPYSGAFRTPTTIHPIPNQVPRSTRNPDEVKASLLPRPNSSLSSVISKSTLTLNDGGPSSNAPSVGASESGGGGGGGSGGGGDKSDDNGKQMAPQHDPDENPSENDNNDGNDAPETVNKPTPDETDENPLLAFDVSTAIYKEARSSAPEQHFQNLKIVGTVVANAKSTPGRRSYAHVKFKKLDCHGHSDTVDPGYRQSFVRVAIDSLHRLTMITINQPSATPFSQNQVKKTQTTERGVITGLSVAIQKALLPSVTTTLSGQAAIKQASASESVTFISRITQEEDRGVVWWGFEVDDEHAQERGLKLSESQLPSADFEFLGKGTAPTMANVEVASYWQLPVFKSGFFSWTTSSPPTSYFNLCQVVDLKFLSRLERSADYIARQEAYLGRPSHCHEVDLMDNVEGEFTMVPRSSSVDQQQTLSKVSLLPLLNLSPRSQAATGTQNTETVGDRGPDLVEDSIARSMPMSQPDTG